MKSALCTAAVTVTALFASAIPAIAYTRTQAQDTTLAEARAVVSFEGWGDSSNVYFSYCGGPYGNGSHGVTQWTCHGNYKAYSGSYYFWDINVDAYGSYTYSKFDPHP